MLIKEPNFVCRFELRTTQPTKFFDLTQLSTVRAVRDGVNKIHEFVIDQNLEVHNSTSMIIMGLGISCFSQVGLHPQ